MAVLLFTIVSNLSADRFEYTCPMRYTEIDLWSILQIYYLCLYHACTSQCMHARRMHARLTSRVIVRIIRI